MTLFDKMTLFDQNVIISWYSGLPETELGQSGHSCQPGQPPKDCARRSLLSALFSEINDIFRKLMTFSGMDDIFRKLMTFLGRGLPDTGAERRAVHWLQLWLQLWLEKCRFWHFFINLLIYDILAKSVEVAAVLPNIWEIKDEKWRKRPHFRHFSSIFWLSLGDSGRIVGPWKTSKLMTFLAFPVKNAALAGLSLESRQE